MSVVKKWVRNIFGFSGREINGFLLLLPLIAILMMTKPIYHLWMTNRVQDFSTEQKMLDSLMMFWEQKGQHEKSEQSVARFVFDPNKATTDELRALGFSEILSTRIASYREKGGQFHIKRDLLKIYGLDSSFYRQLYPYILLPEKISRHADVKNTFLKTYKNKQREVVLFDLNTADTTQLKSVYGIGHVLASRIVRFREKLGGFIGLEQLKEVYGLDQSVIDTLIRIAFIAPDFVPKKIDMNVANEKDLTAHPYIKRNVATAIVAYRFQHGSFSSVEDIHKLNILQQTEIDKILPYLTVNH